MDEKNIFVTGASSGIGKQCAIDIAKMGANILVTARRENLLKELMTSLEGTKNQYCACDIMDIKTLSEAIESFVKQNGKLDGVVFSHGYSFIKPIITTELFTLQPFKTEYGRLLRN